MCLRSSRSALRASLCLVASRATHRLQGVFHPNCLALQKSPPMFSSKCLVELECEYCPFDEGHIGMVTVAVEMQESISRQIIAETSINPIFPCLANPCTGVSICHRSRVYQKRPQTCSRPILPREIFESTTRASNSTPIANSEAKQELRRPMKESILIATNQRAKRPLGTSMMWIF